jgi:hypothetical protein
MLTTDGLGSLRMAATLALTLPTVRVRIESPTAVLAEVGWHLDGPLKPCAFRMAVGRAWDQRRQGVEVDFCGLGDAPPVITVTVAPGERVLPGDIYQVRAEGGGWHHVVPTLLSPEGCNTVLGCDGPPLSFHDDPVTGVTLVHTETDNADLDRPPHLAAHLTAVRGRLLAEELIADPLLVRR